MNNARTVLTFIAGLVVGGAAIMLTPRIEEGQPGEPGVGGPPGGAGVPPGGAPGVGPLGAPPTEAGAAVAPPVPGSMPPEAAHKPGEIPGRAPPLAGAEEPAVEPLAPPLVGDGAVASQIAEKPQHEVPGARLLSDHLADAGDQWLRLAERADRAADSRHRQQAGEMRRVAALVPDTSAQFPPLQDVVVLLVEERLLVDALRAADFDTGELGKDVDTVLRKTVGRIPGGAKLRAQQLESAPPRE